MEKIGFIKRPENIEMGNKFFGLFEVGEKVFLHNINTFIQEQNWQNSEGKSVREFSGSLNDFLELAQINKSNQITVVRALEKAVLAVDREQREKHSGYLPLSYVNIINKDGAIRDRGELMQAYNAYWKDLSLAERKFYKFNSEIVVDRQSPDPEKQAIIEAVSNSLDSLRDVQIGEKGLGVKQFLAYLNKGGKISVKSKKKSDDARELKVAKGADGNYYEKVQKIENFPSSSGTILSVELGGELTPERIKEIEEQIRYTFRLTLGVQLILNNRVINNYDKIYNLAGERASEYQATKVVRVNVKKDKIEIIDGGTGMDNKTLSTMFVARAGTKEMAVDKTALGKELWLLEDEQNQGKIFFSRGSEILESADCYSGQFLNYAQAGILMESPSFRVPDSRQTIFIDEQFLNVIVDNSVEILESEKEPEEKIRLLNSIFVYLENKMKESNLGDVEKNREQNSKIILCIEKIKKQAQVAIEQLQKKNILMPNQRNWQKVKIDSDKEIFYINERLFNFDIEQIPGVEIVDYLDGAKVFTVDFENGKPEDQKFIKYNNTYLFDKSVLNVYEQISDPFKKNTLKELIELSLNPIVTSYDEKERHITRSIKINKKEENKTLGVEQENEMLNGILSLQFLMNFERLNENMGRYVKTAPLENGLVGLGFGKGFAIIDQQGEIQGEPIKDMGKCYTITPLENGLVGLRFSNGFVIIDQQGEIQGEPIKDMGWHYEITPLENGLVGLRFSKGFVIIDQQGEIQGEPIKDMGGCDEITLLENGLVGLGFYKGFVIIDQQGEIQGEPIKDMEGCREITPLENGLVGLGFDKGFVIIDQQGEIQGEPIKDMGKCYTITLLENGLVGLGFYKGFVIIDQQGEIQGEPIKDMGKCYTITLLENGLVGLGFYKGFAIIDQQGEIQGEPIKDMGGCDEITLLENGLVGLGFGKGFVIIDQQGEIQGEPIKDMGGCDEITLLENGLVGLRFSKGFVIIDQQGEIQGEPIKDMGGCDEITLLENGLVGLGFGKGFAILDIYNFKEQTLKQINSEKTEKQIDKIISSMQDIINKQEIEDVKDRIILIFRNKLKKVEQDGGDLENIKLLPDENKLKKLLHSLQEKIQSLQSYGIDMYKEELIFNLLEDVEFYEQALNNSKITQEIVLTIKRASLLGRNINNLEEVLNTIQNPYERNFFCEIIDNYLNNIGDKNIDILITKLDKVKNMSIFLTFKNHLQSRYGGEKVISFLGKYRGSDMPADAFLRYLESDSDIEIKEMNSIIPKEAENVFGTEGISTIELYLLAGQGNVSDDDMRRALITRQEKGKAINGHTERLIKEQIKKEIRGQGAEDGIYVREIFQNVGDASLKQSPEVSNRNIFDIRTWQEVDSETGKTYFVEEYKDNGVGISSLATLLVAQVNAKKGEDRGYFGSGFLSIMEDADIVEIKTSLGDGKTKYVQIKIQKGSDDKGVGFEVVSYKKINEKSTGTTIVRKTEMGENKLPQLEQGLLEANILKNTALWELDLGNKQKLEVYFNGKRKEKQSKTRHTEVFDVAGDDYLIKIEQGKFSQLAHGDGLRMSNIDSRYLELVPNQILDVFKDLNLSIVLDRKFPLIKDRSRIAKEKQYLSEIQKAVANAIVKVVIKELLVSRRKFVGWSDDYFDNLHYHLVYDNEEGQKIIEMSQRINTGKKLTKEEWKWLSDQNDPTSKLARLMVLMEVDYKDKIITLQSERIKVLTEIERKIKNSRLKQIIDKEIGMQTIDRTSSVNLEGSPVTQSFLHSLMVAELNIEEEMEKLQNDELELGEKQILKNINSLIKSVYGDKLTVMVMKNSRAAGKFQKTIGGDIFWINKNVLNKNTGKLIETIVHEITHYEEGTENHGYNFSHQVKGMFGTKYREVVNKLLMSFVEFS